MILTQFTCDDDDDDEGIGDDDENDGDSDGDLLLLLISFSVSSLPQKPFHLYSSQYNDNYNDYI